MLNYEENFKNRKNILLIFFTVAFFSMGFLIFYSLIHWGYLQFGIEKDYSFEINFFLLGFSIGSAFLILYYFQYRGENKDDCVNMIQDINTMDVSIERISKNQEQTQKKLSDELKKGKNTDFDMIPLLVQDIVLNEIKLVDKENSQLKKTVLKREYCKEIYDI